MKEPLDDYIRQRNRALMALDMDWARKVMPFPADDTVRLMAMHKARVHCVHLTDEARRESQRWLVERGLTDHLGMQIDLNAPLPGSDDYAEPYAQRNHERSE